LLREGRGALTCRESGVSPVFGTSRDEFDPSSTTRNVLAWARAGGTLTIGDALEMLDALENSNDVPEVLGESDDLNDVRDELEAGIELVGDDRAIDDVL
jgi:hypothetical protein